MKAIASSQSHERQTQVINFRVTPTVEAQLASHLDPASGATSPDRVARKLMLEALAKRELERRLSTFSVNRMGSHEVIQGEALDVLSKLPGKLCRTCVTSPPYWRQRDYRHPGQLGQESTPEQFVNRLADVLMEFHRVLRDDGTLWVNLDDTYYRKQLAGIPWRLALELQRRGWFWRSEIVWAKASTPESVKDRPTRAHEPVLLFSKRQQYFYDYAAMLEPHDRKWALDCIRKAKASGDTKRPPNLFNKEARHATGQRGMTRAQFGALMNHNGRNRRDVWQIPAERCRASHSAMMPVALAEICLLAGTKAGDIVLDPFSGTGTTGVAALKLGRRFLGIELMENYAEDSRGRLQQAEVEYRASGNGSPTPSKSRKPSR